MKRFYKFLMPMLLMVALAVPNAGRAQMTLTVADGTTTNNYVPVYGLWMDDYIRAQMIYPASMLTDMTGSMIDGMTFYIGTSASSAWSSNMSVKLTEVSATTFSSSFEATTNAQVVYTGTLNGTGSTMAVTFSTPYVYGGGNLLVEFSSNTEGNYSSCYFYGITSTGSSVSGYSSTSASAVSATQRNFLPKVTFSYIPSEGFCPAPANPMLVAISPTSATISWSTSELFTNVVEYNIEYGEQGFVPGTGVTITDTSSSVELTGLTAGTHYDVYLSTTCTDSNSSIVTLTFHTPDNPIDQLPYACGFEADEDSLWTLVNGTCVNQWFVGSSVNNGGSRSLYISNDNGTSNAYNISSISHVYAYRDIDFAQAGDYAITFDWRNEGESYYYDWIRVFLAPAINEFEGGSAAPLGSNTNSAASATLPEGWIDLSGKTAAPYTLAKSSTWVNHQAVASIVTAGTYRLVFMWSNDGGGGTQPPAAIDNINVYQITCPAVRNLVLDTNTAITSTSVTLDWTSVGDETTWAVRANGGEWETVTTHPYTVNGLEPSTAYTFEVVALCGDTSFVSTISARTACAEVTALPFTEGFEGMPSGTGSRPICWTSVLVDGSYPYVSTTNHSGTNSLYLYCRDTTNNMVASSLFSGISANQLHIKYWARPSSNGTLYVGLMTDTANLTTFEVIDSVINGGATWREYECYTDNVTTSGDFYLAFRWRVPGTTRYSCYIDDIEVLQASSCRRPATASVDSVSYYTATLSWVDNLNSGNYVVRYSTVNDVDGDNVTDIAVNDTAVTLTGLSPYTLYYAWVATSCDGVLTDWRAFNSFRTLRTCYPVTNLTVTEATASAASLSWQYNSQVGIEPSGVIVTVSNDSSVVSEVMTDGTSLLLTQLQPGTNYHVAVRTFCDPDTAEVVSTTFSTASCGELVGTTTVSYAPFHANYNYGYTQTIYPASVLAGMDSISGIAYRVASSSSMTRTFAVYVGYTTQTSLSTSSYLPFTSLTQVASVTGFDASTTGWKTINFSTPVAVDHSQNIVIAVVNTTGSYSSFSWGAHTQAQQDGIGNSVYWYRDASAINTTNPSDGSPSSGTTTTIPDIRFIGDCDLSCVAPLVILDSVGTTDAYLHWTADGILWVPQYRAASSSSWTDGGVTSETSVVITDLTPSTLYQFRVMAICEEGDTAYSATHSAYTACAPVASLPYEENFDAFTTGSSSNWFHPCWPKGGSSSSYMPYITTYDGSQVLHFYNGSSSSYGYVILPEFDASVNFSMLELSFDARKASTTASYGGQLIVAAFDSAFFDLSTDYDTLAILPLTNTTMEPQFIDLTSYTGTRRRLGFINVSPSGTTYNYVDIDNLSLHNAPDCPHFVGAITVDSVSYDAASLQWPAVFGQSYHYEYYPAGDESSMLSGVTNDPNVTLTDLTDGTTYIFRVTLDCASSTDTISTYFTTRPLPITVFPYNTGFEMGQDMAWGLVNDNNNAWYVASLEAGNNALFISNNGGTSNNYSTGSFQMSYAYRTFEVSEAGEYVFGFDWRAYGEGSYDYIRAWIAPASFEFTAHQLPDGTTSPYNYTTTTPAGWIDLANGKLNLQSSWQNYVNDGVTLDTGLYNLVFMWTNDGSGGSQPPAAIDNVMIGRNACSRASNLEVLATTATDITIGFTGESGTTFRVYWNGDGIVDSADITTTTYTITGLSSSTRYTVSVSAICDDGTLTLPVSVNAVTDCGSGACEVLISMVDSYGDGWNGNAINGYVNGVSTFSATITSGTSGTYTYSLCSVDTLVLYWNEGSYPDETSFSVSIGGNPLVSGAGDDYDDGDIILTNAGCPTCPAPQDFTVDSVNGTEAFLSWIAGGEETEWSLSVNGGDWQNVNSNPYTVTGLTPRTDYTFALRANCGDGDTSNAVVATATTNCLEGGCSVVVEMVDSYGDGWNDAAVKGYVNGVLTFSATIDDGSTDSYTYSLCSTDTLMFSWQSGEYDDEASFTINIGGSPIVMAEGSDFSDGETIFVAVGCPTCPMPLNLVVDSTNATEAYLSWTAGGSETEWSLRINDSSWVNIYSNPYTVTGLNPSTHYTFTLRANCGADDTSYTISASAYTACMPIATLPYQQNFEGLPTGSDVVFDPCWAVGGSRATSETPYITSFGGSYGNVLRTYAYNAYVGYAILPEFDGSVDLNTLELSFDMRKSTTSTSTTTTYSAQVIVAAFDSLPVSADMLVYDTIAILNTDNTEFETQYVNLSSYYGNARYLGFVLRNPAYSTTSAYNYVQLDNIDVHLLPDCPRPGNLAVTSALANDITVTYTGNASSYQLVITDGTTIDTVNTIDTFYTFTGLTPVTLYTISVASNCGTEISPSIQTSVSTTMVADSLPYYTGFEAGDDTTWFLENGTQTNRWVIGSAVNNGGSRALYISNDNGATNSYTINSTSNVMAYKTLSFDSIGDYAISFDWLANGEACCDYLRVMLAPGNYTFIPDNTNGIGSTGAPAGWIALDGGQKLNQSTSWQSRSEIITISSASNYNLVIFWHNDYSTGSQPPAAIDNIQVTRLSCPAPQELAVSDITGTSATLTWTPAGSETEWQVSVGAITTIVNVPFFTVTGLDNSTNYTAKVRAICSAGDTGLYCPSVSFTTEMCDNGTFDTIGNVSSTTTSHVAPVNNFYKYTLSETIIDSAEIGGSMNINAIGYYYNYTSAMTDKTNVDIWIQPTSKSTFTDNTDIVPLDTVNAVLVYSGSLNCTEQGWNYFSFNSPYSYNGSGNLLVIVDDNSNDYNSSSYTFRTSATTGNKTLSYYSDSYNPDVNNLTSSYSGTKNAYAWRPLMQLVSCGPAVVCDMPTITNLTATENTVTVSFTGTADNYEVAIVEGNWVTPAAGIPATGNSHTFTGLDGDTMYTVGVRAICGSSSRSAWNLSTVNTTVHACAVPTNLAATTVGLTEVTLNWTPGEEGQNAWQIHIMGTNRSDTIDADMIPFTLSGLLSSETYAFAVRAVCDEFGTSEWGDTVSFTTLTCVSPYAPAVESYTSYSATLSWSAPANASGNYEIEYGLEDFNQGHGILVPVSGTSFTITGLTPNRNYDVYVRSICATGAVSGWSDVTTIHTPNVDPSITYYNVTVAVNDPSRGSVYGGSMYQAGATATLIATANEGYHFVRWNTNDTNATISFVVNSDVNYIAYFEANDLPQYTITVLANDTTMGTVTGGGTYGEGSVITLGATANMGYHFDHWSTGETTASINVTVTGDTTYTAYFVENDTNVTYYTVTANVNNSAMGYVTGAGQYEEGATATLTAVANNGYRFVRWSNGATTATITFTVTEDVSLTATFEVIPTYTLTVNVNNAAMGYVIGVPEGPVPEGTQVTLTAVANTGYRFQNWSTGEVTVTITVTVNSDMTLTANFFAVGIDDVANAAINLYPNPATNFVTLTGIEGMATVTVVDMNGRNSGKWIVTNGELTIDVTDLAQGAYFVRIVGEQVNAIRKLIVR